MKCIQVIFHVLVAWAILSGHEAALLRSKSSPVTGWAGLAPKSAVIELMCFATTGLQDPHQIQARPA